MAQPQHGPVTPVDDLRNIVDRLDLLMETTANASAAESGSDPSVREQIEAALAKLGDRVDAVERETGELRTLVNHLMTIATWQAKVTATLVAGQEHDNEAQTDDADDAPIRTSASVYETAAVGAQHAADPPAESDRRDRPHESERAPLLERSPTQYRAPQDEQSSEPASREPGTPGIPGGDRLPEPAFRGHDQTRHPAAPSLDDDIDDILGTHRAPPSDIGPPPDFGI